MRAGPGELAAGGSGPALLAGLVASRPGAVERLSWLVLLPAVFALSFRLGFAHRSDYLGHFLAGFGASLVLIHLVRRLVPRPGSVAAATALCLLLGWLTEHTIFRLAAFDPIDFHCQSIGALLAGLSVLHARTEEGLGGTVLLVGGFSLALGTVAAFS